MYVIPPTNTTSAISLFSYIEDLVKAGRLPNTRQQRDSRGRETAEHLMKAGIGAQITWMDDVKCKVPSQSSNGIYYNVDIARATCTCPASTQGGMHFYCHML